MLPMPTTIDDEALKYAQLEAAQGSARDADQTEELTALILLI